MLNFGRFALKILLPSFLISWGIKALAPWVNLTPANGPALALITLPPLAIAVWLGWQEWLGRIEP